MSRLWPALAVVLCATARGATPSYSAAGIVSTASYAPAPFAPNTLVTIFGKDLADGTRAAGPGDLAFNALPILLLTTRVYVNNSEAPLLFVSEGQINFLLPPVLAGKSALVRVFRNGQTGPEIAVAVADTTPGLFAAPSGFAIATHADGSLVAIEKPAAPGETIVLYATGLGKTVDPSYGNEIPHSAAEITAKASLRLTLNGAAVDPAAVLYAGVTPQSAGLYQINFMLPASAPVDPEVRVTIGDTASQAGLKLALRPPAPQLSGVAER